MTPSAAAIQSARRWRRALNQPPGPRRSGGDDVSLSTASTVPRRCREPGLAEAAERRVWRRLRRGRSMEEPVERGACSGHVGAEGAGGAELLGERRAREVVRREGGEIAGPLHAASPSRSACAALCEAGHVLPRVEGCVDVGGRGLRRRRAGAGRAPRSPAAGRAARARCRRRSRAAGRRRGRTGRRRRAARPGRVQLAPPAVARASVSFASRSAVAASELPPPRPAATGIRFSIRTRQRGSTPALSASARARRGRACRPRSPRPGARRLVDVDPVDEVDALEDGQRPRACRRRAAGRRRARG